VCKESVARSHRWRIVLSAILLLSGCGGGSDKISDEIGKELGPLETLELVGKLGLELLPGNRVRALIPNCEPQQLISISAGSGPTSYWEVSGDSSSPKINNFVLGQAPQGMDEGKRYTDPTPQGSFDLVAAPLNPYEAGMGWGATVDFSQLHEDQVLFGTNMYSREEFSARFQCGKALTP
jgi:hypothetical protein